jgi:hypothetical protein
MKYLFPMFCWLTLGACIPNAHRPDQKESQPAGAARVRDGAGDGAANTAASAHAAREVEGLEAVSPGRVALSADGKLLLLTYRTKNLPKFRDYVKLRDAKTGKHLCTVKGKREPSSISFLPNGKRALVASYDGTLTLFEVPSGKVVRTIQAFKKGVGLASISADGKDVLTHGSDKGSDDKLKLWEVATGKLIREIYTGAAPVHFLAISPDKKLALSGGDQIYQESKVQLWNLTTGKLIRTFPGKREWGGPFAFSPDGKLVLLTKAKDAGSDRSETDLILWDVNNGKVVKQLEGQLGGLAAFMPGGKQVIAQGGNHTVKFWNLKTGKVVRSVSVYPGDRTDNKVKPGKPPEANTVEAFALSSRGTRAAAVTGWHKIGWESTLTVKVWDLAGNKLLATWQDPTGE